jgi:NitT/TauT family transport system substrate-binding protein
MKRHALRLVALAAAIIAIVSGCSLESLSESSGVVNVVIGYQSKTINTVTAGTLLRAQGYLERRIADINTRTGTKYAVRWQDYDTGAPITAQMLAEKIDIGSMGDYPLLINGSKTQANPLARTELVAITGYNPKGALNMVVVSPGSSATTLTELAGTKISASVGSAGHGTLVRALAKAGINPSTGVEVINQQPQIGASALESGQVQALSQFVAWPGLLVYQGKARLLYDGAELNVPTCTVWWCDARMRAPIRRCWQLSCKRNWTPPTSSTKNRSRQHVSSPRQVGCRRRWSTSTTVPAVRRSTPR